MSNERGCCEPEDACSLCKGDLEDRVAELEYHLQAMIGTHGESCIRDGKCEAAELARKALRGEKNG